MKIKLTDINAQGQTNDYVLKVQGNKIIFAPNTAGLPSGGTTSQYLRGDGSWQTLDKSAVGLSNVNNTADSAKPLFTTTTRGLVPQSGSADATYFLNAQGNWSVPAGSGGGSGSAAFQWANPVTATGTGASQNITLPESGLAPQAVLVKVSGIVQHTNEYTISGTTLTITTNAVGAPIEIVKPLGLKGETGLTGAKGLDGTNGTNGATGPKGDTGAAGPTGATGPAGANGTNGTSATVDVGTVTTGAAGSSVQITNSGNTTNAVLNFTVPRGDTGLKGDKGDTGSQGIQGIQGVAGQTNARRIISPTWSATMTVDVSNADTVRITLGGNTNITFTGAPDGHKFNVELTQDGTGNRVATLNGVSFGFDYPSFTATTTANKRDLLAFWVTGTAYQLTGVAKGF